MANHLIVSNKINKFNKTINVSGDKSLSIRWVLFASLANGISKANNLLKSEDVIATLNAIKKLGIKYKIKNDQCIIYGKGIGGYKYKKNIIINANNSGTLQNKFERAKTKGKRKNFILTLCTHVNNSCVFVLVA